MDLFGTFWLVWGPVLLAGKEMFKFRKVTPHYNDIWWVVGTNASIF